MLITDALVRFDTQLDADGRSVHTREQYGRHIHLLATWADSRGGAHAEVLTPDDLARFLASSHARHRADGRAKKATSLNALRSSIRCFCAYLCEAGLVPSNPARLIRRAITEAPPPRALRSDEAERLFGVIRATGGRAARRDEVLFSLLLATGVRLSSALQLDVEDVDFDDGTMRVWVKRDRIQVVYLPATSIVELRRFVGDREGRVFIGPSGRQLTPRTVQRRFGEWRDKAGISKSVSPHSLRHAFATELYRKTQDVLLVRAALGHASLSSSLVYVRVDEARLREALGVG